MHLLLFGCTGFIGSELVPRLLSSGHQITIVSRRKKKKLKNFNLNTINFINANPANLSCWNNSELINSLTSAEGIINLAGEPIADKRWTKKHREEIQKSRHQSTQYLINAISKLKRSPSVLINGSAIGFYGTSLEKLFDENSSSGEDFLAKLCYQWESIASKKPSQTRLVTIRTGIVLGKDGGALAKMIPVFRAGFGGPIGSGKQWMSWIHRSDLCQIIEQALTRKSWSGVFNGVSPNPVTMYEFCNLLGKSLNRPSLVAVPGAILKILLGDGAQVVLQGQRVSPKRLAKEGFKFNYPNLDNAFQSIRDS
tara:strand:- start:165 stop:1094 length:930 start_codon:yes stop_codon:yes gene_type:complete